MSFFTNSLVMWKNLEYLIKPKTNVKNKIGRDDYAVNSKFRSHYFDFVKCTSVKSYNSFSKLTKGLC